MARRLTTPERARCRRASFASTAASAAARCSSTRCLSISARVNDRSGRSQTPNNLALSRLGQHHVIERRLDVPNEFTELRPLLPKFRRMVRGGEAFLVGPLDVVHDMRAVLAA